MLQRPTASDSNAVKGKRNQQAADKTTLADTTKRKTDSQFGRSKWPRPGVALCLGLAVPGAAQGYNKQFWKMPLVWGALFALGAPVIFYHNQFVRFDDFYKRKYLWTTDSTFKAQNPEDPFPNVNFSSLQSVRNNYLSLRDTYIFWFSIAYFLQALEGYVAAHLRYFTVSDDLALGITPSVQPPTQPGGLWVMGGKLSLHFR